MPIWVRHDHQKLEPVDWRGARAAHCATKAKHQSLCLARQEVASLEHLLHTQAGPPRLQQTKDAHEEDGTQHPRHRAGDAPAPASPPDTISLNMRPSPASPAASSTLCLARAPTRPLQETSRPQASSKLRPRQHSRTLGCTCAAAQRPLHTPGHRAKKRVAEGRRPEGRSPSACCARRVDCCGVTAGMPGHKGACPAMQPAPPGRR